MKNPSFPCSGSFFVSCKIATLFLLIFFAIHPRVFAEIRTWTDSQGRTVKAEYVGVNAGKVGLKMESGKVVAFPFAKLSKADQALVRKLYSVSPANIAKQIDSFVDAKLAEVGVKPNPMTTDEQFVRRAYLEIAGTIPNFSQTLEFLESTDRNKRRKLIDRLLDSEEFVSHSFNWYADLLRVKSRTNDFFIFENYIEWIKDNVASNKPWDRFVYEMLTAKGRLWDDPATGYFIRDRGMPLGNLSSTVAVFLATEITCAECHDHPYEDWTQRDFYGLAAFLGQKQDRKYGREWGQKIRSNRERIEAEQRKLDPNLGPEGFLQPFRLIIAANGHQVWDDPNKSLTLPHDYKYKDGQPNAPVEPVTLFGEEVKPEDYESPRVALATWMTSKKNPMFTGAAINRLWKRAFGLGLHEPLDNIHDVKNSQNPKLFRFLERSFKDLDFNVKDFLRSIYYSQAWQRQATLEGPTLTQIDRNEYHFPGPVLKRMTAEQLWDSFLTLAVPDPMQYRRDTADALTQAIKFEVENVDGAGSIERTKTLKELVGKTISNGAPNMAVWTKDWTAADVEAQRMKKFAGAYLARASEIVQPAPASHFLRAWGQSPRILVDGSSDNGSIPQILTMINGPFTQMLIKPDSLIFKTTGSQRGTGDKMENIYLSLLSRYPKGKEKAICSKAIRGDDEGYGDLIWALVNTREFLFIQ